MSEAGKLRARVNSLEAECFSLATHQCDYPRGTDGGTPYCELKNTVESLRAELAEANVEINRLKDRLEDIDNRGPEG